VRQGAEPRLEREHPAERQQWQTAGAECTVEKAQAHGHQQVLSGQGKPTGNMVIIQRSQ